MLAEIVLKSKLFEMQSNICSDDGNLMTVIADLRFSKLSADSTSGMFQHVMCRSSLVLAWSFVFESVWSLTRVAGPFSALRDFSWSSGERGPEHRRTLDTPRFPPRRHHTTCRSKRSSSRQEHIDRQRRRAHEMGREIHDG